MRLRKAQQKGGEIMKQINENEKSVFDYSLLRGRIRSICVNEAVFAKKMGFSQNTLTRKFKKDGFDQLEIDLACTILSINPMEINIYFFTKKVGKSSTN